MDKKSLSDSPLISAQKPQTSDHPLGRILEPLGFYKNPVWYASSLTNYLMETADQGLEGLQLVFSHASMGYILPVVDTVTRILVVFTVRP